MSITKGLGAAIPKIRTDKVYVLKEDGNLKLENWSGTYSDSEIEIIGTVKEIPVIRDKTIYDILKKNLV